MSTELTPKDDRTAYVAPRMTTYTEQQVADSLGPVLLSGGGTELGQLTGNESPSAGNTGKRPRR
jgi:hypothetical protein